MSEGILLKVQYPPGTLKKSATVKVFADQSAATAVQEIAKTGHILRPEEYLIYCSEGSKRKWLLSNQTLSEQGISTQTTVILKRKYQMIKVKVFLGPQSQFSQSILMDICEPLQAFLPFALKKFQLDSSVVQQYAFLLPTEDRHRQLSLSSSLFDLDVSSDVELILVDKEKSVTESALRAKPTEEKKALMVNMTGNLTFDKKKRWIVVDGNLLFVHKSSEEADPKKPVESVNLQEFCVILDDKDKKKLTVELVSIKSRKDIHQIKFNTEEETASWYNALKGVCAPDSAISKGSATSYFGAPIEKITPAGAEVPYIVEHCIRILEEKALEVEGLFRLSGGQNTIDKLKAEFNSGVMVDLSHVTDPHNVSGLLKLYFRELPEPLLTYDLYESFVAAQQERDPNKRIRYIRHLISCLPKVNRSTLKYLIRFLGHVEKHSEVNKMAIHNLATVFAPNLLQQREENLLQTVHDTPFINGLVSTFIKDFDSIFSEAEPAEVAPVIAKALYDYAAQNENQLSFKTGDLVRVYQQGDSKGWWYGELNGNYGLFPGSYVQVQPVNKREQFIAEMNLVRAKIAEEKKHIAALEQTKVQLQQEMNSLKVAKETALSESKDLKVKILAILNSTDELGSFNSELEKLYSQLEAYHKTRLSMQQTRSNLLDELSTLKRALATEPKFKKFKDKLGTIVDSLVVKLEEEQAVRKQVDEKKDTVFKDLTELRGLIGHK